MWAPDSLLKAFNEDIFNALVEKKEILNQRILLLLNRHCCF